MGVRLFRFILLLALALSACAPATIAPTPTPEPTDTPAPPTLTPTTTPVWFPPTATPTPPFANVGRFSGTPGAGLMISATLDMRPRYGVVIFKDDFSNKVKWNSGKLGGGLAAFGKNELALAVRQEKAYLSTLRSEPTMGDFYLEVSAAPSICRGADEYGVLFRYGSAGDLFRFGLTCNGKARVDRILGGQASSPQPPSAFGSVPPGAPSRSRLGVWAAAGTMHFYANGEYLFTVRDASLGSGGFGLYARASGPDELTVAFSDLVVYQAAK